MSSNSTAAIHDPGTFVVTGSVSATTSDKTSLVALAGAMAYVASNPDHAEGSTGLAGSFALVAETGTNQAWVNVAHLAAAGLAISSDRSQYLLSAAAGGSGSVAANAGNLAVAGSVAYNYVRNSTTASLSGGTVTLSGDASVTATDSSIVNAGAGAGSSSDGVTNSVGIGAAVAVNQVQENTTATIASAILNPSSGNLTVAATNSVVLVNLAVGVVSTSGTLEAVSFAAMIGVNLLENSAVAEIENSSCVNTGTGGVTVSATDTPIVVSVVGGAVWNKSFFNASGSPPARSRSHRVPCRCWQQPDRLPTGSAATTPTAPSWLAPPTRFTPWLLRLTIRLDTAGRDRRPPR
jgi:hypothetical protein